MVVRRKPRELVVREQIGSGFRSNPGRLPGNNLASWYPWSGGWPRPLPRIARAARHGRCRVPVNMARQETTIREPMLDGGGGIGIVGEGDAVLSLPGTGGTGNEFESLHAFGPLAGVVEKWGEVVGSTDFKRTQMDGGQK